MDWLGCISPGQPITPKYCVFNDILEIVALAVAFPMKSLALHTELFKHTPGCWVTRQVTRLDAVELQRAKGKLDHRSRRFRRQPLAPVWAPNPLAQFTSAMLRMEMQRYSTLQLVFV